MGGGGTLSQLFRPMYNIIFTLDSWRILQTQNSNKKILKGIVNA